MTPRIIYLIGDMKNKKECQLIDQLIRLPLFQLYTCSNKTEIIKFSNNTILYHTSVRPKITSYSGDDNIIVYFSEKNVQFELLKKLLNC